MGKRKWVCPDMLIPRYVKVFIKNINISVEINSPMSTFYSCLEDTKKAFTAGCQQVTCDGSKLFLLH